MSTPSRRPNILFAIADDASHFGCYGHAFVRTPHADRVAREGVRFTRMFTTNPKCAPSRASLLTGMHTWQLEEACTHWCHFPGPDRFTVYPDVLEEAGYHVGYTGKGWAPGDWKARGRSRNPAGPEYNKHHLTPPDASLISPTDYDRNFEDFLAARPDDAPFCFWYGCREPHRGYAPGEGLANGKSFDELDGVPPYWPDEEVVRSDVLDYAFETEWFDTQLGKMLDRLDAIGELENTLVIVTSDNGCPFPRVKGQMYDDDFRLPFVAMWPAAVPGGRVVDDLCSFIDVMPTFLELAGCAVPDALPGTSLTDVLCTATEGMVTSTRTRAVMGRERHDMGREGDRGYPVRCIRTPSHLYVRNHAPERWPAGNPETGFTNCDGSPTKTRILELHAAGDSRYFDLAFGKRPAEELYDIEADPYCMHNLAASPAEAERKTALAGELEATLRATGDPRVFGNGDIFDTYAYVSDAPHSWANYIAGTFKGQAF